MASGKMTRKELKEEIKRIKKERKILRKNLREKGIKSRHEFETIAHELGLVYPPESFAGFMLPWFIKGGKVDFSYTGITEYNGQFYHIQNGKVV